jgi:hypothetical protein
VAGYERGVATTVSLLSIPQAVRPRLAWFTRWSSASLAVLALVIPLMAFAEAWNVDHPLWQVLIKGRLDGLSVTLLVLCILALIPIGDALVLKDYEFLFGAATMAMALLALLASVTALMPWIAFSAAAGARWFGLLLGCWILALVLIAFDWVRKDLILASVATAVALSSFVVRAGYNDLRMAQHQKRSGEVTAAVTAKQQLDQQAGAAPAILRGNADAARQALAAVLFEVQPPNVPAALQQASLQLYRSTPTTYDRPVNPALVETFDELAANQPTDTAVVVTGLKIKTQAFVDAVSAAASLTQSPPTALARQLQSAIGQARKNEDAGAWPTDAHAMTVALSAYRAGVSGTDADKKAYQAALAAPLPPPDPGFGVLEAVTDGPQALWTGATKKNLRPLVPGPLGWVLLGALALGIWGSLLRKNAQQLAGPVSVQGDDKTDAKLLTVLRVAVLRNLAEPGAAPGAGTTNAVTDLIGIAGGALGPVGKIVDVVSKVAGRRYGYEVTMDVTSADTTAGPTTVLIKLKSIAGEQTFATGVFERDTGEAAVRTAGLWAAGRILERSSRIPSWAAWNADTAGALSTAYQEAPTAGQLELAVKNAPGSGLLLAMLGQQYELTGGHRVEAIEMYARAVAAHPRYLVARYRLGAALATMRDDPTWAQLAPQEKEQVLRTIERAAVALHISVTNPATDKASAQPDLFMRLAREFLHELRVDTRLWHRLVAAIRRSERDAVAPLKLIRWSDPDARFHPVVKSVCLAYAVDFDGDKVMAYANKPRRWWQVSYNAACGLAYQLPEPTPPATKESTARQQQANSALRMLEQTLIKPGIEQLSAEWVNQDADLEKLRSQSRYADFIKQLRAGA